MKKILIWFFYIIVALIIAAILLPFVFEDKIKENLKQAINENINAKVDFSDVSLSLFKDFPQMAVTIDSLSVMGIEKFEGKHLLKAENITISLPLKSLISKGGYQITKVSLVKPDINIIALNKTEANYLITKETQDSIVADPVSFEIALDEYEIEDGKISYTDILADQEFSMSEVNHSGKGNFTQEEFDLVTKTTSEDINFSMAGIPYLKNANGEIDALIKVNMNNMIFSYQEADIRVNSLSAKSSGSIDMEDNEDIVLDINFATIGQSFKNLLSVVPSFFTKDFEKVKSDGTANITGTVTGIYNGNKNMLPAFDISFDVNNGFIKYPDMPKDLKNVFVKAIVKSTQAQMQDLTVNIPSFSFLLGDDQLKGNLKMNLNEVAGSLNGKIDLQNWHQLIPNQSFSELKGIVSTDMTLDAKITDIQNNNIDNINFSGSASVQDFSIRGDNILPVKMTSGKMTASPAAITMNTERLDYGKSDFGIIAEVNNPLNIFVPEKESSVKISTRSQLIDFDDMMASTGKAEAPPSNPSMNTAALEENNTSFVLDSEAKTINFNGFKISNAVAKGNYGNDAMKLDRLSANIDQTDIQLSGDITGIKSYLFNNDTLRGNLNLISDNLDMNQFMVETTTPVNSPEAIEVISVPERTNLNIQTKVKKVKYTNLEIDDIEGAVIVKDQKASLSNVYGKSLGGTIAMEGTYDTKNVVNPKVDIKLLFDQLSFNAAFSKIEILQKIAPITKYIDGKFNSTFAFNSTLDNKMMPKLSSVSASGFLETLNGVIDNFLPFNKLGEKLGLAELKHFPIDNTKNWFEVADGRVVIHPFTKNWKDINMDISGSHFLEGDMDYNIKLQVPRALLKSNNITGAVESGFSFLEKEAGKYGVNLNQGEFIDLMVSITGKLTNPTIKIKPIGSSGQSVKSQIETGIKDKIDETKAEVKEKVDTEIKKAKDSINTVIKTETDKIKTKVEEKKEEAIDTIKSKATSAVKKVIDKNLPDSLGGKTKEEVKDKAQEEIDKIKDKLGGWNPLKKKGG